MRIILCIIMYWVSVFPMAGQSVIAEIRSSNMKLVFKQYSDVVRETEATLKNTNLSKKDAAALSLIRGKAFMGLNKYSDAATSFDQCLIHDAAAFDALVQKGICAYKTDSYAKSIYFISQSLLLNSINPEALLWRGRAFIATNKLDSAKKDFDLAIKYQHDNAELLAERGYVKLLLKEIGLAFEDFEKAIAIDENYCETYFFQAEYFFSIGSFGKASTVIDKALDIVDANEMYLFAKGKYLYFNSELKKADSFFQKVIELNPAYDLAYYYAGLCKMSLNDYATAVKLFTSAIVINSKSKDYFVKRGLSFSRMGQPKKACVDFQRAIDLGATEAIELKAKFCK